MKIFKLSFVFALFVFSISAFGQKMKPEEVLAKHLESIGTAENRAAVKNQIAVGYASVKSVAPKNQPAEGRIVMASAGEKNFLGLNLSSVDYPSEKFVFDGKAANIGFARVGSRSVLANFIKSNDIIISESLLGGTLMTSWALLNVDDRKPKISFEGTKKIDGKEVYVLGYSPKGSSNIDINLYFDKETFRHVRTEYKRTSSAGIGTSPEQSSRFQETRFKITEDFSEFKTEKNITLPHKYKLNYSVSGQNGTTEIEWTLDLTEYAFNQNMDANTFKVD